MSTGNNIYTIGEIASLLGIKTSVIRFWEKEFPHIEVRKNKFGHRVYSEEDLNKVRYLKELLHDQNISLKDAKTMISGCQESVNNSLSDAKSLLIEALELINKKREEL